MTILSLLLRYSGNPYKSQEGVEKQDMPPLTLEQRQQARQLWMLWQDFTDTMYALMERCASDPTAAPALLTSIEQFHTQAETALRTLGLLTKAAPSLATLKAVSQEVRKAGAVMSGARRQRLQEAIDALQALLDEAMPQGETTSKGTRMSAYDEIKQIARGKLERGECPTLEQAIAQVAHERPDLRQRYDAEPKPRSVVKAEVLPAKPWSLVQLEDMAAALVAKGVVPTKEQGMVQAMKTSQGRELAAAYRERDRG
jgi:hypothetical protein